MLWISLPKPRSAGRFFTGKNPDLRRIFCEAVITPPLELSKEIIKCKSPLDKLNIWILKRLLSRMSLRSDISVDEVVRVFCQLQDIINVRYDNEVAVGVTIPLLLIMVSIENIFAAGAGVLAGRQLGAGDNEAANRTVTTMFVFVQSAG